MAFFFISTNYFHTALQEAAQADVVRYKDSKEVSCAVQLDTSK